MDITGGIITGSIVAVSLGAFKVVEHVIDRRNGYASDPAGIADSVADVRTLLKIHDARSQDHAAATRETASILREAAGLLRDACGALNRIERKVEGIRGNGMPSFKPPQR